MTIVKTKEIHIPRVWDNPKYEFSILTDAHESVGKVAPPREAWFSMACAAWASGKSLLIDYSVILGTGSNLKYTVHSIEFAE